MASNQHCLYFALLFLFIGFTYSHSPFLSYCPVDMEGQSHTILTSKCKGPKCPPAPCCEALLEFCCGFVDELNDVPNNFVETMFSYINLYGQYPPGLFASQCKEGEEGLSCEKGDVKASSTGDLALSLLLPPFGSVRNPVGMIFLTLCLINYITININLGGI